jgi:NAD dependent epimerase/dehydratase
MKSVLVTGAGGFIGSHLSEELVRRGFRTRAFIHYNSRSSIGNLELVEKKVQKEIDIRFGNIEDFHSIKKSVEGIDTVFHLAALIAIPYSYEAPASYINTNVQGTLNVLQACLEGTVEKIVHTSTSETYGTAIYTPIDEKHPLQGQSPYSASKIGADKIAESFYRSFSLPVATIRPFNTYGPRQSARAVIPTIITQALTTKSNSIRLGLLTPVRDLTYVGDTVDGFIRIAQSDKTIGEVTNIGYGKGITIGELADQIISLINPDLTITSEAIRFRPEKSEVMELICDNSKARQLLGWNPATDLKTGLKNMIEFIRENLLLYNPDTYTV